MQWKSKYFEKTSKETHTNIFKSLEIERYLQKAFKNEGLNLQNYQINFSHSIIHISLSVCKIKPIPEDKKKSKKNLNSRYLKQSFLKKLSIEKKYASALKYYKNNRQTQIECQKVVTIKAIKDKILKNLKVFSNNKQNIYLTIKEINYLNSNKNVNQTLKSLHKFKKTSFFKKGEKTLTTLITQENAARLLGEFMAINIKSIKQQSFFLDFVKESLKLVTYQKCSKLQGIKIIIKGRIKNADRSRNLKITMGKISLISMNSKTDYSESTSYTSNGTIGIKIWTSKNEKINYVFAAKKNQV